MKFRTRKRWSEAELKYFVQMADIKKLLDLYGIERQQMNSVGQIITHCPFHDDTAPSFSIAYEGETKGTWRCFAANCTSRGVGNLYQFIMDIEDCFFPQAVEKLKDIVEFDEYEVSDFVMESLRNRVYKKKQKKKKSTKVQLPYGRRSVTLIRAYLSTPKRPFDRKNLIIEKFGLYIKKYEPYQNWIVIPIFDISGQQISYMLQATQDFKRNKRYPADSRHTYTLFSSHLFYNKAYIIIVEGIWDAIRLIELGYPAVSSFMANVSESQRNLIYDHWEKVILLFDPDIAGRNAEVKAKKFIGPSINVVLGKIPQKIGDPKYMDKYSAEMFFEPLGITPCVELEKIECGS